MDKHRVFGHRASKVCLPPCIAVYTTWLRLVSKKRKPQGVIQLLNRWNRNGNSYLWSIIGLTLQRLELLMGRDSVGYRLSIKIGQLRLDGSVRRSDSWRLD